VGEGFRLLLIDYSLLIRYADGIERRFGAFSRAHKALKATNDWLEQRIEALERRVAEKRPVADQLAATRDQLIGLSAA